MSSFSQRHNPTPDTYRYTIPEHVRNRLIHAIHNELSTNGAILTIDDVFDEMGALLLRRRGVLRRSAYDAARVSDDPVYEHFFRCSDEEVMDFLALCFETRNRCGGQETVEAINFVLNDENIGYELTAYSKTVPKKKGILGRFSPNAKTAKERFPKVIRKDERVLHAATVKPCLDALSDPRFTTASAELLSAFEECRQSKYADAITDAGRRSKASSRLSARLNTGRTTKRRIRAGNSSTFAVKKGSFILSTSRSSKGLRPYATKLGTPTAKAQKRSTPRRKKRPTTCSSLSATTSIC